MADDLMMLQRQAAHRVRQMQEHSRRVFEAHQEPAEEANPPRLYHRPEPPPAPPPSRPTPGLGLSGLETEQWMLLGLALLLYKNGCRPELTLALLYLAL